MMPAKTPVALPRNVVGSIPARSNASHDNSSSMRCCGSVASASVGDTPKNAGVEIRDVVDESTSARVTLVRRIGVVVEQAGQIPAPVGRELRHHVALVGDHVPQAVRRVDPTGESARHPDDRDRLA